MKRTVEQCHLAGAHRDKRRPRCPLCAKRRAYMTASNRPSPGIYAIRPGFGYCTPAGIR